MQTPTTSRGEPYNYALLHLLTEARADGRVIRNFVCFECMDLVEREAGVPTVHDCLAKPVLLPLVQELNAKGPVLAIAIAAPRTDEEVQEVVFKGCQRCNGDLWVEVDIVSRMEGLVCVQCGHHQVTHPESILELPVGTQPRREVKRRAKVAA